MNKFEAMAGNNMPPIANQEMSGIQALVHRSRQMQSRGMKTFEILPSIDGSHILCCDGEILGYFYSRNEAKNALNAIMLDTETQNVGHRKSALMS